MQQSRPQDKFKNIVLKIEPVRQSSPDPLTPHPVRPTHSPTNYPASHPHLSVSTSHIIHRPSNSPRNESLVNDTFLSHSSTYLSNQPRQSQQKMITHLQTEINQKESIINQLRDLLRLSHQNSGKSRISLNSGVRSQEEREVHQLKHNVKILTIENNTLSDYIQRIKKKSDNKQHLSSVSQKNKKQINNSELGDSPLKSQISRLNLIIQQQQTTFNKKVDELISSHKEVVSQCQVLQQDKQRLILDNRRLQQKNKEFQNGFRTGLTASDNASSRQKPSIQKIKQQYGQSLKQFKQTVAFETEHLFDKFRTSLQLTVSNVNYLQGRVSKVEQFCRKKGLKQSRTAKKSQIYIEESGGSSMSDNEKGRSRDSSLFKDRPFVVSRVYEDSRDNEEEMIRPLREQVVRLKQIINELSSQIGKRGGSSKQRQWQQLNAELNALRQIMAKREQEISRTKDTKIYRQISLLKEVDRQKQEITNLEQAYQKERIAFREDSVGKERAARELMTELQKERHKCRILQIQKDEYIDKNEQGKCVQLQQEIRQCLTRIEQYKKLCQLLKQQSDENSMQMDSFLDFKGQVQKVKDQHKGVLYSLEQSQNQRKILVLANQQIKQQLQDILITQQNTLQFQLQAKLEISSLKRDKQELSSQMQLVKLVNKGLQEELSQRAKDLEGLVNDKKKLQKQIMGYLCLLQKTSLSESRVTKIDQSQELRELQSLMSNAIQLQSSWSQWQSSRRQKKNRITRLLQSQWSKDGKNE